MGERIRGLGASWVEAPLERQEKLNPMLVKALSFGQWPLTVDWLWIRALQDPALSHVAEGTRASIYYDFDLATDLDPAFANVYVYGPNLLSVVRDDNEGARDLLLKGSRFIKEDLKDYPESFINSFWSRRFWIPLTLGYIYMYELYDVPNAAIAFKEASETPGAPDYLASLSKKLETRSGQYEVAINILLLLIANEKDDRVKEGLEKKRKDLLIGQYLYQVNTEFTAYLKKFPDYRRLSTVSGSQMARYWEKFRKDSRVPLNDPLGGVLSLDESGRIQTSTPWEKVFGLE